MEEIFKPTKEQSIELKLKLIKKGLNDVQISDVFQRIKTEADFNKYTKK